jgi:hypothetical protein
MTARRRVVAQLGALATVALGLGGCGGNDDFENEPRPPAPIEVSASIKDGEVSVSPSAVGAGLVNFTIANQSTDPATLTLDGPTDDTSNEIAPGTVASLKTNLDQGIYEVTAGADSRARSDQLKVGPERPSSQNDLLLP